MATQAERDDVKALIRWYEQRGLDWTEAAEFLLCKYNGGLRSGFNQWPPWSNRKRAGRPRSENQEVV